MSGTKGQPGRPVAAASQCPTSAAPLRGAPSVQLQTWGGRPVRCRISLHGNRLSGSLPSSLNHTKSGSSHNIYSPSHGWNITFRNKPSVPVTPAHAAIPTTENATDDVKLRHQSLNLSPGHSVQRHRPPPLASYHGSLQDLPASRSPGTYQYRQPGLPGQRPRYERTVSAEEGHSSRSRCYPLHQQNEGTPHVMHGAQHPLADYANSSVRQLEKLYQTALCCFSSISPFPMMNALICSALVY